MDAVLARVDRELRICDPNAVVDIDSMSGGINDIHTARDYEVALADDAVPGRRSNRQTACTVDGQVLLGEQSTVDVVIINGNEFPAVGKRIFGALRQRQEHLIRLEDIQRRGGPAADLHAVKNELNLCRVGRINDKHAVVQGAGNHIGRFLGDPDRCSGNTDGVRIGRGGIAAERDMHAAAFVITVIIIAVGKQVGFLLGNIRRCRDSRRGAVRAVRAELPAV